VQHKKHAEKLRSIGAIEPPLMSDQQPFLGFLLRLVL